MKNLTILLTQSFLLSLLFTQTVFANSLYTVINEDKINTHRAIAHAITITKNHNIPNDQKTAASSVETSLALPTLKLQQVFTNISFTQPLARTLGCTPDGTAPRSRAMIMPFRSHNVSSSSFLYIIGSLFHGKIGSPLDKILPHSCNGISLNNLDRTVITWALCAVDKKPGVSGRGTRHEPRSSLP